MFFSRIKAAVPPPNKELPPEITENCLGLEGELIELSLFLDGMEFKANLGTIGLPGWFGWDLGSFVWYLKCWLMKCTTFHTMGDYETRKQTYRSEVNFKTGFLELDGI